MQIGMVFPARMVSMGSGPLRVFQIMNVPLAGMAVM